MKLWLSCAAIVLLLPQASYSAETGLQCADRSLVREALARNYGEEVRHFALQGEKIMWEFYVNPETGTWTVMLSQPDGRSCYASSGTDWQDLPPKVPLGPAL